MTMESNKHEHVWRWNKKKRAYICECGMSDRPIKGETFWRWLRRDDAA